MPVSLRAATVESLRRNRGRPSSPWHSMADMVSFAYLARISGKYGLDVTKFFECIGNARMRGESSFDDVSIKRRLIVQDGYVFLITKNQRIVAQLKLTRKVLEYLPKADITSFLVENPRVAKQAKSRSGDLKIKDLSSNVKSFNLRAKVTEKSIPKTVFSKFGETLLLSTATISDGSGKIRLSLWNDQIDTVSVGDLLHIENAQLKRYRGELQVKISKFTDLRVIKNE